MFKTKEEFKYEFSKRIIETYGRTVEEAHITEKFLVLELMGREYASVNWATSKALIRNIWLYRSCSSRYNNSHFRISYRTMGCK